MYFTFHFTHQTTNVCKIYQTALFITVVITTVIFCQRLLLVPAPRTPPRGDGGQRSCFTIRQSSRVNGVHAVMAGTSKCFTMQGLGSPVSATGQGKKAGPQLSSSCNRSSSLLGDLGDEEYEDTRRTHDFVSHDCSRDKNMFCFVCGKYEISKLRRKMTDTCMNIYRTCYKNVHTTEGNTYVPDSICCSCYNMLRRWDEEKDTKILKYSSPTIWSIPESQNDCYFCNTLVEGFTAKTKTRISYATVASVIPAKTHAKTDIEDTNSVVSANKASTSFEIPDNEEMIDHEEESDDSWEQEDKDEEYVSKNTKSKPIRLFNQESLSDFIRNMGLPKDVSEYMSAELKSRGMVEPGTTSSFYRNREENFRRYFTNDEEGSLVYCTDICGLMSEMKQGCYVPEEWRLFIDSSKQSLKAVLLHNGNDYASLPIAHSTRLKESYENVKYVLDKISYNEHKWQVCGDLKIITILLGQQSGFTKYPCFLCLWDSRDRANHYKKKIWQKREELEPGHHNVLKQPLVDPTKILLPPLHIKLGLMKQFVKALDKEGACFQYMKNEFPQLSEAKVKEGIFDGPQIRRMFNDEHFVNTMNDLEKAAWLSFRDVARMFLGNQRSRDYEAIVANMVRNFRRLKCLMSIKLHFLDSHLSYFPENLGDYSEEQGERFHQDLKEAERRWQGKWDVNMMADYCWLLKRDVENDKSQKRVRNPLHRSFANKRERYRRKKE